MIRIKPHKKLSKLLIWEAFRMHLKNQEHHGVWGSPGSTVIRQRGWPLTVYMQTPPPHLTVAPGCSPPTGTSKEEVSWGNNSTHPVPLLPFLPDSPLFRAPMSDSKPGSAKGQRTGESPRGQRDIWASR